MRPVDIYIDTSLRGPGKRPEGEWMYIIAVQTAKGTADVGSRGKIENTTDNQLSIVALEKALHRLKEPCHIVLHLECDYMAAAVQNRWYETWRQQDWQNARGKPVADEELWKSIESMIRVHEVEVILKRHHSYKEWMTRELKGEKNV